VVRRWSRSCDDYSGSYFVQLLGLGLRIVTSRVAEVVLSYVLHSYRPRFHLSNWRELVWFSKWVYLSNSLVFLSQRGPEFLIGKICGPGSVGLFSVGYDIALLPTSEMVAPINRAVFPGYVKMSKDAEQLREGYLNVIGIIALIALPTAVGIAATADVLVPLILGNKWLETIPIVKVLAFAGALPHSEQTRERSTLAWGGQGI